MSFFQSLPQWLQAVVVVLGAVSGLCTALSVLLRLVAAFWAPAGKAADELDHVGVAVKAIAAKLAPLLGRAATGAILMVSVCLGGCSWFASHEPAVVHGAADVVLCVLEHDSEPIGQIASECYGIAEQDVVAILFAHRQAMLREQAGKAACSLPDAGHE